MKKLFTITLFWAITTSFSQTIERSNEKPADIVEYSFIDYSVGYKFENGEWIEFDRKKNDVSYNIIPDDFVSGESDSSPTIRSISYTNNFKKISTFWVMKDGIQSLFLVIQKRSGKYEYPAIMEDWYDFDEAHIFQLDFDEWKNFSVEALKDFNEAKTYELTVKSSFSYKIEDDSIEDIERLITLIIDGPVGKGLLFFDLFPVKIDGVEKVRFLWSSSPIKYRLPKFDPLVFNKYYFEADIESFKTFLK